MSCDLATRSIATERAAWLRFSVVVLLLEVLLAQVWPALHHAFFAHAICAEHGEVIHVSALSRAGAGQGRPTEKSVLADPEGDAAHAHCQVPPGTRDPASEPDAPLSVDEQRLDTAATPRALASEATPSIALLALAPKLPPPC